MRTIKFLTEEERGKYEKGLALLWKQHDATAPGSAENIEAKKKITDFGKMLVSKITQRRQQQQLRPLGAQQPQQVQPSNAPQASSTMDAAATGPPSTPTTTSAPVQNSGPANTAAMLQQLLSKLPPHLLNHINEMSFQAPPNAQDKEKWVQELKIKYSRALLSMEHTKASVLKLDQMIKDRKEKGQPLSAEEEKMLQDRKAQFQRQHQEANNFIQVFRKQMAAQRPTQNGAGAPSGAAPAQAGNQVRPPQQQMRPGTGQPTGAQLGGQVPGAGGAMQQSTATVNAAIEAAKNQQRMAGAAGMPGQQGLAPHPGQVPTTAAQAPSPAVAQAPPAQVAAPQQQHLPQQTQIKMEPGSQNPNIPAPLNTAMAAGLARTAQASGTPQNSAPVQTPQSATAMGNDPVRPLTHAAALNLAAQRPGSISGQSRPAPVTTPTVGVQQGHPHAHPAAAQPQGQAQPIQSKLPIAKTLPEKAMQIPTPVSVMGGAGGGRPTYSGGSGIAGGVMGQPALAKTPAYQLEGEGERVLNKKKLDELVRQVCGGTAEGQEGNLLTPEVEESVLSLADHFVDNVLQAACRNAKERGSKVLEIRDLQLVLERSYNIRIPGYSSEELRTVRKVQPNAQWITKMSAVQAAKVMPGGKGDL
ncbi:transcription initiation factor TFIID subunit A-domain-containing protein [Immersiella caudata]|uniref:Transcription initiation factor TFIID subunit A-domain-containing protein n=1 Tax=Immersiella caudata TaxID=314043 RepID=A0AA39W4F6_9PEZI|nr:transcription initiation factor TFIID subunit A-domain-containing protein [Immersiella caudata]